MCVCACAKVCKAQSLHVPVPETPSESERAFCHSTSSFQQRSGSHGQVFMCGTHRLNIYNIQDIMFNQTEDVLLAGAKGPSGEFMARVEDLKLQELSSVWKQRKNKDLQGEMVEQRTNTSNNDLQEYGGRLTWPFAGHRRPT